MARAVARSEQHLDVHVRELQPLAALDRVLGLPAFKRAEARHRPFHDVRKHAKLDLGAVHGRACGSRDRRHRADVVEMAVGDQDRLDLDAKRRGSIEQALRLFARVDHQRAGRLCVGAHQIGVLLNWTNRELADVDHLEPALPTCLALLAIRRLYSQLSV